MVEPCAHESHGAAFGVHVDGRAKVRAVACLGHRQGGLGGIDGSRPSLFEMLCLPMPAPLGCGAVPILLASPAFSRRG
jgi:hypothetical protein